MTSNGVPDSVKPDFDDPETWEEAVPDELDTALSRVRDLRRLALWVQGGVGETLDLAVRAAQRAFDEIRACNAVLDRASLRCEEIEETLHVCLTHENAEPIPGLLDELDVLAAEVAESEAIRRVVNRILSQDGDDVPEEEPEPVPVLTAGDLPRVPSLYDSGEPDYGSLTDMWDARESTATERADIHTARIDQVATHLLKAVERLAETSFQDERFARETLAEIRRAYDLWGACVEERRVDS